MYVRCDVLVVLKLTKCVLCVATQAKNFLARLITSFLSYHNLCTYVCMCSTFVLPSYCYCKHSVLSIG